MIEMEPPSEYLCPLTLDVMKDPVMSKYGQSFERTEILQWLRSGHGVCPLSRRPLSLQDLVTNHGLRMKISDWRKTNFGDSNDGRTANVGGTAGGGGGGVSPNDDDDLTQNQMIYGFITLPAKDDNLTDRTIDEEEDLFYLRLAALRLAGGGVAATGLQQQQQQQQQLQSGNITASPAAAVVASGGGRRRRRQQQQRRNSTGSQRQLGGGRQQQQQRQRQSSRSIRRPFRGLRNLLAGPSP